MKTPLAWMGSSAFAVSQKRPSTVSKETYYSVLNAIGMDGLVSFCGECFLKVRAPSSF
jgi:hypothetical protein